MTKIRKHNEWDVLKCVATLLVVIGHITILYKPGGSFPEMKNEYLASITDMIYMFHMPLFIAISGAVYAIGRQYGKYQDIKGILRNKAERLLIPYYSVALLFLAPTIILLQMNSYENSIEYFFNILLGSDCRHLWYLWALFWIFIIVSFCKGKYFGNPIICMVIATMLSVGCSYYEGADLFCFRMTVHYLPYFFLGEWMYVKCNDDLKMWKPVVVLLLSGCILKLTDIKWMDSFFSILMSAGIVVFVYLLARKVSVETFFRIPYMTPFSKNSFEIYLFHIPLIYILVYYLQNYPIYILLPVVGVVAIMGSILLSAILRKMRLQSFIGE